jgi:hypothetical protein
MSEERKNIWKEFIENEKYKQYFKIDNEDLWSDNLNELKKIINTNNKRPCHINLIIREIFTSDKEKQEYEELVTNIKKNNYLAHWISDQNTDYKQNKMAKNRNDKWKEFIENDKYNKYFMTPEEEWYLKFEKMKIFIKLNKKRPPRSGLKNGEVNEEVKNLGNWLHSQTSNYKNKKSTVYKNEKIRKAWKEVLEDDFFGKYLNSN